MFRDLVRHVSVIHKYQLINSVSVTGTQAYTQAQAYIYVKG